jgi:NTP pyrophosphatase (non-canonical NTP hydrolase)
MKFSEYQAATQETAIYPGADGKLGDKLEAAVGSLPEATLTQIQPLVKLLALGYVVSGLAGETGEVCEKIKKIIRDSGGTITEEAKQAIGKELGDQMWYQAQLATLLGLDLGEIAAGNLEKLRSRKERGVLSGSGDNR